MEKINWINGQSGGTPLSAENLNLMQDNIEDGIEVVDNKFTPVTLFTGDLDTLSEQGTLSDSITNYEKLVILYHYGTDSENPTFEGTTEFYPGLQTQGSARLDWSKQNTLYQYHYGCDFTIENNLITITGGWAIVYDEQGRVAGFFTGNTQLHITKIIGYK